MVCFHTGEENKLIPFVAKMCRLRATVTNRYGREKKGFKVSPAVKEGEKKKKREEETMDESQNVASQSCYMARLEHFVIDGSV